MEYTSTIWIISIAAAVMIGMSKTGVSGLGTLVVPLMAFAFGGMPSSGMVLPMLIMADVFGVIYYHRSANWKLLLLLLPWALIGLFVGLIVGKQISAEQFRQLIAILILISIVIMLWQEFRKKHKKPTTVHSKAVAAIFGITGGFSTMIGNAAGPVMSVYLLSRQLPKAVYIGTTAWFFFIINITKLPLQIWVWHNITIQSLLFNLSLLPAIAIGAYAGIKITAIIPENTYRWFVIVITVIASVALFF